MFGCLLYSLGLFRVLRDFFCLEFMVVFFWVWVCSCVFLVVYFVFCVWFVGWVCLDVLVLVFDGAFF